MIIISIMMIMIIASAIRRLGRTGTAITKGANKSGQSIFNDD